MSAGMEHRICVYIIAKTGDCSLFRCQLMANVWQLMGFQCLLLGNKSLYFTPKKPGNLVCFQQEETYLTSNKSGTSWDDTKNGRFQPTVEHTSIYRSKKNKRKKTHLSLRLRFPGDPIQKHPKKSEVRCFIGETPNCIVLSRFTW